MPRECLGGHARDPRAGGNVRQKPLSCELFRGKHVWPFQLCATIPYIHGHLDDELAGGQEGGPHPLAPEAPRQRGDDEGRGLPL